MFAREGTVFDKETIPLLSLFFGSTRFHSFFSFFNCFGFSDVVISALL